jgi:hypothetical protein
MMRAKPLAGLARIGTALNSTVHELNLGGFRTQRALALLQQAIELGQNGAMESMIVQLDARPAPGERDNLLVPIGLQLAWACHQGLLMRHRLLAGAETIQFFVEFPNPDPTLKPC